MYRAGGSTRVAPSPALPALPGQARGFAAGDARAATDNSWSQRRRVLLLYENALSCVSPAQDGRKGGVRKSISAGIPKQDPESPASRSLEAVQVRRRVLSKCMPRLSI